MQSDTIKPKKKKRIETFANWVQYIGTTAFVNMPCRSEFALPVRL